MLYLSLIESVGGPMVLFHRLVALQHDLYANGKGGRQGFLLRRNKIISGNFACPRRRTKHP
jgi:hypothetical protein